MYILKVYIYDSESEYVVFNNENDIEKFINEYIETSDNYNPYNDYNLKIFWLDDYIYKLRDGDVMNNELKESKEFDGYLSINDKNVKLNRLYWKKIKFDYHIKINLEFGSDSEEDLDEYESKSKNNDEYEFKRGLFE